MQNDYVFNPLVGQRDAYDLRQNSSALFPPTYYITYLASQNVMLKIGAEVSFQPCNNDTNALVLESGDVSCCSMAFTGLSRLSRVLERFYQNSRSWLTPGSKPWHGCVLICSYMAMKLTHTSWSGRGC